MIVQTEELKQIVKHMLNVYDKSSTYDVERNIRMQWDADELIISAFNINQHLRIKASISANDTGDILVDPAFLYNLLSTLGEVTKITESNLKLSLSSGNSKLKMNGLSSEFWPDWLGHYGTEVEVPWNEILLYCQQATIVSRHNRDFPVKSGIFFTRRVEDTPDDKVEFLEMVSADGHRLLSRIFQTSNGGDFERFILPGPDLISVKDVFNSEDIVHMFVGEKVTWFASGLAEFSIMHLDGSIPKYEPLVAMEADSTAVVKREDILRAINQANMYSRAANDEYLPCYIEMVDSGIRVTNDEGLDTLVPAETDGDTFKIKMTPGMALEVIRNTREDEIKIWHTKKLVAIYIQTSDSLFITMGRA